MIEIHQLTKRFGDKTAVDQLDLEVRRGELFCFLGPNGAGKTTTIKVLTGLLRPTSGRAAVGGHDVVSDAIAARRLLGYIPDHPFLYDKLTGRETLRLVAGLYRMPRAELDRLAPSLLDQFELTQAADLPVESYSHGMKQKLSFASCFLHQPDVVVVDEPWVGLDPKNIRRIKDDLKRRTRSDGLTVFMSTHSLAIAEELADRVGILDRGKLLGVGTVDEIRLLAGRSGSLEDVFLELTRDDDVASGAGDRPGEVVAGAR